MKLPQLNRLAVAAALALAGSAHSASWLYTGADSGSWIDAANWTLSGGVTHLVPLIGDDAVLGASSSARNLSFDAAYTGAGLYSLTINASAQAGSFTLNQSLASSVLIASVETIGTSSLGNSYTQSAGSNTTSALYLGNGNGSFGTYNLSGSGVVNAIAAYVGVAGGGVVNVTGGTFTVASVYDQVADSGTAGRMTLGTGGGTGTLNLTAGSFAVNGYVDNAQNVHFGSFTVGGAGGAGVVNMGVLGQGNAPSLYVGGHEYIGQAGAAGNIAQAAGSHRVDGDLQLGSGAGSTGSYVLSGGNLSVGGNLSIASGAGASGSFAMTGGTATAGAVQVGNAGAGTLAISGGALNTGALTVGGLGPGATGAVTQTGGIVTASAGLVIGQGAASGSYVLSGPGLFASGPALLGDLTIGANGNFSQYGGSLNIYQANGLFKYPSNSGHVTNGGTFLVHGGAVALYSGFTNLSGAFATFEAGSGSFSNQLGTGLLNFGVFNINSTTLKSGQTSSSIDNRGTINIGGQGAQLTAASFTNAGHIAATGGSIGCSFGFVQLCSFSNSGDITVSSGVFSISEPSPGTFGSYSPVNSGMITGASGAVIYLPRFLQNFGTIAVNGATVNGFFKNAAGGIVSGGGTIALGDQTDVTGATLPFNEGTIAPGASTLRFTDGFTNAGLVQLSGPLSGIAGGAIDNQGTIQGVGSVSADVSNSGTIEALGGGTLLLTGQVNNTAVGTLVVSAGNKLLVQSGLTTNAGTISATSGGTFTTARLSNTSGGQVQVQGATLRVTGAATNDAGAGINLNGGTAFFTGGLNNGGQLNVSFNGAEVYGAVTNNSGGKIILTGNSNSTFYGTVDVTSGSELRVSAGSTAVFFGQVFQRNGALFTGTGNTVYEGGFHVGSSPGYGQNAGNVSFGSSNVFSVDIGGVTACTVACATDTAFRNSSYGRYVVAGQLSLGGTLKLSSWNGFVAQAGESFSLLAWGSEAGVFSSIDASGLTLAAGTVLDTSQLYSSGTISVQAVPEPESWALMLGGLAALGLLVRRRLH